MFQQLNSNKNKLHLILYKNSCEYNKNAINDITEYEELKKEQSKKRQTLKFAFFLLCFLTIFLTSSSTKVQAEVVNLSSNFYVSDYANILSSETEQYIINTNVELEQKTGAQIIVVTVPSLDGMSIEEYANELFNKNEFGDKTKENGLLLLCSYEDRRFRVEVGYGLEGILPDGKTGRMQDEYIIPYLKENNFDEGIKNGYSAFLQEVANEYDVTITGSVQAVKQEESPVFIILEFILPIILFIILSRRGGPFIFFGRWKRTALEASHGGGFSGRRRTLWWRRKQQKFLKNYCNYK